VVLLDESIIAAVISGFRQEIAEFNRNEKTALAAFNPNTAAMPRRK